MKKKQDSKKLTLNRETVRLLETPELDGVAGGIISSDNLQCTFSRRCPQETFA
jgi:hypothetical protein